MHQLAPSFNFNLDTLGIVIFLFVIAINVTLVVRFILFSTVNTVSKYITEWGNKIVEKRERSPRTVIIGIDRIPNGFILHDVCYRTNGFVLREIVANGTIVEHTTTSTGRWVFGKSRQTTRLHSISLSNKVIQSNDLDVYCFSSDEWTASIRRGIRYTTIEFTPRIS